jgi:hypothetical protein
MTHFKYERFSRKFELILALFNKILVLNSLELHDVSDAQSLKVFALVQVSQDIFHVKWLG